MAFHPAEVPLDDAAVEQLAKALQAVGCDNLDYLDFVLDRMTERCKGRPPKNPAGYLLRVAGLAEWYADWRRAREARQAVLERATAPPEAPARDEAVGAMLTDFLNGGLKGAGG